MFECVEMKELFVPELYWRNPYNLFALPVSATPREVRRKREDIESSMYSVSVDEWACTALRPKCLRIDKAVQDDAFESLKKPVERLFYSFFWFWPLAGIAEKLDAACNLIITGRPDDRKEALTAWSRAASSTGRIALIAKHNLAIYFHLIALIFEDGFERGGNVSSADCDRYWDEAIRLWNEIADDDDFWEVFSDYVRRLDDPTLTTGMVRRLRHDFPFGFDQINALLLKRHFKAGEIDDVRRQLRYMRASQEGLDDIPQTLDEVVDFVEKGLNVKMARISSQVEQVPERGLDLAREILGVAESNLSVLAVVVGMENRRYVHIADDLAANVLHCQVVYAKQTDDWGPCIKVLEDAMRVAASESSKKRLEKNLATVRDNLRFAEEEARQKPVDDLWLELHEFLDEKFERIKENGGVGLCLAEAIIALADTFCGRAKELFNASHDIDFHKVSDEIARAILACAVAYGNKTDDWKSCLPLLDKARCLAVASELLKRIDKNIETLNHNIENNRREQLRKTCWICKVRPAEESYARIIPMHGELSWDKDAQGKSIMKWKTVDVRIPRCRDCADREGNRLSMLEQEVKAKGNQSRDLRFGFHPFMKKNVKDGKLALLSKELKELKEQISNIEKCPEFPDVKEWLSRDYSYGPKPEPQGHWSNGTPLFWK